MENENTETKDFDRIKDAFLKIFITQIICVIVIAAGLYAVSKFSPRDFDKVKNWYEERFKQTTDIREVLNGDENNAI